MNFRSPFSRGQECTITGAKDVSIFKTNIPLLNKFLKHFASCFSKKNWPCLPFASMPCLKTTRNEQLHLKPLGKYFHGSINKRRNIQNQRSRQKMVACQIRGPKPYAKHTKWQECATKREEICNVGVCAAFVSSSKHFPIDIIPYLPADEFPGKKQPSL